MGVTGSIAAYKAAELASSLTQAGAQVDVLLSESAQRFVAPLTFQALTGRRAWIDNDLWGQDAHIVHVELARQADVLLVAPATATTLARLAMGLADTLIGLVSLACTCPLVVAPAMDAGMYAHPATQRSVAILRERGAILAGPVEGRHGLRRDRHRPHDGSRGPFPASCAGSSVDPGRWRGAAWW